MPVDRDYLEEKLRGAASTISELDAPVKDRVRAAYVYYLSNLESADFPDDGGRAAFEEIQYALTRTGEAVDGEGSVPTTLWLMEEGEAEKTAAKIVALAGRYEQP
jgi:hypothetical protein